MVLVPARLALELITDASGDLVRDLHPETVLGCGSSHHDWQTSHFFV